ncbi:hypothetical protein MATL_G00166790 [Megalops atlanticus]|uniref:Uncharacterized protein n=1 Tax=Megalops atlanticus TaxID=7932 RepID=A0A9D3PQF5_MEGAT|nr:hypothetical protein MATL_G00166790 [Megalops atlanticus]
MRRTRSRSAWLEENCKSQQTLLSLQCASLTSVQGSLDLDLNGLISKDADSLESRGPSGGEGHLWNTFPDSQWTTERRALPEPWNGMERHLPKSHDHILWLVWLKGH